MRGIIECDMIFSTINFVLVINIFITTIVFMIVMSIKNTMK